MSTAKNCSVESQLQSDRQRLSELYRSGASTEELREVSFRIAVGEGLLTPGPKRLITNRQFIACALVVLSALVVSVLYAKRVSDTAIVVEFGARTVDLTAGKEVVWWVADRATAPVIRAVAGIESLENGWKRSQFDTDMRVEKPIDAKWELTQLEVAADGHIVLDASGTTESYLTLVGGAAGIDIGGEPSDYPLAVRSTSDGPEVWTAVSPLLQVRGATLNATLDGSFSLDVTRVSLKSIQFREPRLVDAEMHGFKPSTEAVKISFPGYPERVFELGSSTAFDVQGFEGEMRVQRASGKTGLTGRLVGRASDLRFGDGEMTRSLKPSWLEWIMVNHRLALFWSALVGLLGIVWAAKGALVD